MLTILGLVPDHGKLLHLFPGWPARSPGIRSYPSGAPGQHNFFEVALPPLPEGDYELFCDLTLESGLSSTATNSIHLPPVPASATVPAMIYTWNPMQMILGPLIPPWLSGKIPAMTPSVIYPMEHKLFGRLILFCMPGRTPACNSKCGISRDNQPVSHPIWA